MKHALLALFTLVSLAEAWDDCGHKTVATIAASRLTPAARTRIDAIFAADARHRGFIDSAIWPDDLKQGERNDLPVKAPVNASWHYVNVPYDIEPSQIDAVLVPPGVTVDPKKSSSANIVTALRYYIAFLKSGKGTATEQADALSWLAHLTGDVHQPLHTLIVNTPLPNYTPPLKAGKSDDRGGNGFLLKGGSASNLHAFWDDLLDPGQPHGSSSNANAATVATAINIPANQPSASALAKTDPVSWARESYAARKFVYSPPIAPGELATSPTANHTITPFYAKDARTRAEKRIVLAGVRLGKVLNNIFGQ